MRFYIVQIYIEAGVDYPFSHHFQKWLGQELTNRVKPSRQFLESYSDDFNLTFNVSAKSTITEPEIKGPTVFKKDKDVEFTIFLPYSSREQDKQIGYERPLQLLLGSIAEILQSLGMDASQILENSPSLIAHFISNPMMITNRKTATPGSNGGFTSSERNKGIPN